VTYPVPGYPLYVDGAYYPAALWRQFDGGTAVQDAGSAAAVSPAGGVFGDPGSAMLVTPGTGMTVTVNAGYCSVPNSSGSGAYRFGLMQSATFTVTAPGSGTRLDYVVAGVNDPAVAGVSSYVGYLTGTSSPPAQPANSVLLAEVSVPSTASSITSGMITDLRAFVAAPGCIVPVASAGVAPSGPTGQLFWDVATGQLLYSPVTSVTVELTGSGNWTCPAYVTEVAARATGGGGGGTGITSGASGSQTFTSSGNWTAPDGVTEVTVQMWGGGGGGGGSEHFYFTQDGPGGGGGGGAGCSQDTVAVTAGNGYQVTVGASAGGGAGSGGSGDSGNGGSGGSGSGPGGAGGGGSAGPGFGGGGGSTDHSGTGGAGGGGYASGGRGGGTGNTTGGGGGSPGAGGGGAGASTTTGPSNGGGGAGGMVIVSWTPDSQGGGGGGGGEMAYNPAMAVQATRTYPYSVGTGGGDSTDGTATSFTAQSASVLANGGQATSDVATGGTGGTGGTGAQLYDGGAGGLGSASSGESGFGGGGGASGSSTGTGADGGGATTTAAGTGGAAGPYGGAGGTGGNGNGANGASPGGGGGGSSGESLGYSGGTGGSGSLTLSYVIAPGAIPYPLAGGQSWYEYDSSTGAVSSVQVTITADGISDYEITCQASGTGAEAGGRVYGTLQILDGGSQLDAIDALSSSGTPAAHYNAGWSYVTSGAQGTTLSPGTHVIEFTSSGVTMTGPASIRVAQVIA
jgi:hypothetical protein